MCALLDCHEINYWQNVFLIYYMFCDKLIGRLQLANVTTTGGNVKVAHSTRKKGSSKMAARIKGKSGMMKPQSNEKLTWVTNENAGLVYEVFSLTCQISFVFDNTASQ